MKKMVMLFALVFALMAPSIVFAAFANKADYEKSALITTAKDYILTEPALELKKSTAAKEAFLKLLNEAQPKEAELLKKFLVDYFSVLMGASISRTNETFSLILSIMTPGLPVPNSPRDTSSLTLKEEFEIQTATYAAVLVRNQVSRLLEVRSLVSLKK